MGATGLGLAIPPQGPAHGVRLGRDDHSTPQESIEVMPLGWVGHCPKGDWRTECSWGGTITCFRERVKGVPLGWADHFRHRGQYKECC